MRHIETIAVLGYGSQGRAMALNLRDSGFTVIVGLRPKSPSSATARKDKIKTASLCEAASVADIIIVALPDHCHKAVLRDIFQADLPKQPALVFLHGASVHFGLVTPPAKLPVLLLAPHAPGAAVRQNFVDRKPYSAFYAVHRGGKRAGETLLFTLAQGVGVPRTHLIRTTFAEETVGDLFGEQAVLCGGLARLVKLGFETLVEAGLPPQNAYLEVAYQLDLIVGLVKQHGLAGMLTRISALARYGAVANGPRIIDDRVKVAMKELLTEIASGDFLAEVERAGVTTSEDQEALLTNPQFDRQAARFADHD